MLPRALDCNWQLKLPGEEGFPCFKPMLEEGSYPRGKSEMTRGWHGGLSDAPPALPTWTMLASCMEVMGTGFMVRVMGSDLALRSHPRQVTQPPVPFGDLKFFKVCESVSILQLSSFISFFLPFFLPCFLTCLLGFLGLHPWHMEIPRLGVKSEPQPQ